MKPTIDLKALEQRARMSVYYKLIIGLLDLLLAVAGLWLLITGWIANDMERMQLGLLLAIFVRIK